MSKTVDFNRFTVVHISNLRNDRYLYSFYCGICMWTVVNPAKTPQCIYYEYILKDRSRKSGFYAWQLFPRTVALSAIVCFMPDFCCWFQLLVMVYYQQSHSDEFRKSKSTRRYIWVFTLPYYVKNTICCFLTFVGSICA